MSPQEAKKQRIDDLLAAGINVKQTADVVNVSPSKAKKTSDDVGGIKKSQGTGGAKKRDL